MRLSQGLDLRQVQKQVQTLAPRMIQSMEILQLPLLALQERIDQELSENPVLELTEPEETTDENEVVDLESSEPTTEDGEKELVVEENNNADDFERLLEMDREVPDYFDERPRKSANRMEEEGDRKHDAMANLTTRPKSLQDYLLEQLVELENLEPEILRIAERIISTLDSMDGGRFRSSLYDLLPPDADPAALLQAQQALEIVQAFDPPGIAAKDLRECLLRQLTLDMPFHDELKTLISSHLEDLKDNRLPNIQRATGYSIERIQEGWAQLRKLNPKPASEFAATHVANVTPDVFVERGEDGNYKVIMDDSRTPSLYISNYYRQRLVNGTATAEEKEFIKRKINAAQWLIESIEQRRNTLTRVAQAIVDHQTKFLDAGPEYIEPLKMQQIADKVGVHVTTVSRAVDDKWMQTPRGIFPLRRCFVGGTQSASGEDVAWDKIRIRLQEIVDKENKSKPLSDDDLVKALAEHGLSVARRTITKYRQTMGIPSSRQRRDWSDKSS
ncbi:MAG TPA: RNA polymerase sigma-54 factor [Planctomycetes bacterium]|nr:RNA polymerase sigma-54 factor [Planctomycetota bacterium]